MIEVRSETAAEVSARALVSALGYLADVASGTVAPDALRIQASEKILDVLGRSHELASRAKSLATN